MTVMAGIIYFCILIYASYVDKKFEIVESKTYFLLCIVSIVYAKELIFYHLIGAVIITAPILIFAALTNSMGGGDIKFIFLNTMIQGMSKSYFSVMVGFLIVVIHYLIKKLFRRNQKKEKMPLVPYLSIGYMIGFVILNY